MTEWRRKPVFEGRLWANLSQYMNGYSLELIAIRPEGSHLSATCLRLEVEEKI